MSFLAPVGSVDFLYFDTLVSSNDFLCCLPFDPPPPDWTGSAHLIFSTGKVLSKMENVSVAPNFETQVSSVLLCPDCKKVFTDCTDCFNNQAIVTYFVQY